MSIFCFYKNFYCRVNNFFKRFYWSLYERMRPEIYHAYMDILGSQLWMKHYKSKEDMFHNLSIILSNNRVNRMVDYARQMKLIFEKEKIDFNNYYVHPFDYHYMRQIPKGYMLICSLTIDFETVLNSNLCCLLEAWNLIHDNDLKQAEIEIIQSVEFLNSRICRSLRKQNNKRASVLFNIHKNMLYRKPLTLDEAIQKILFYDALFWQANHWHIGLGRLDVILYPYYKHDLDSNIITKDDARKMLLEMCYALNRDVKMKSKTIKGDTGQYILLGGIGCDDKNVDNELTLLFLEIFMTYDRPDPKLILRVNKNTSDKVWSYAIDCIASGSGSPLIMNEEPILENMVKFGYSANDVYKLGTSACWEPLIIGQSFDQNNSLPAIIALDPLEKIILEGKNFCSFEDFFKEYKNRLSKYIATRIFDIEFDCSPLFTLFFNDCLQKEKEFTMGGARYSFHGIQVISLPNVVNSLLNIKEFVFDKKIITLVKCRDIIDENFDGFEDLRILFKGNAIKYGSCNEQVLNITNALQTFIGDEVSKYKMNGQNIKVGFSSPTYIMYCNMVGASLDGRKRGEAFAVHISPLNSKIDLSEIMDFASHLNYDGNRINGNVVDFIVPNSYLKNREKFCSILRNACDKGIFELQLNVLSYQKLVEAKSNPEKYKDLIVRVWGFSAYFNDLPEIYKDNLIERARLYESA